MASAFTIIYPNVHALKTSFSLAAIGRNMDLDTALSQWRREHGIDDNAYNALLQTVSLADPHNQQPAVNDPVQQFLDAQAFQPPPPFRQFRNQYEQIGEAAGPATYHQIPPNLVNGQPHEATGAQNFNPNAQFPQQDSHGPPQEATVAIGLDYMPFDTSYGQFDEGTGYSNFNPSFPNPSYGPTPSGLVPDYNLPQNNVSNAHQMNLSVRPASDFVQSNLSHNQGYTTAVPCGEAMGPTPDDGLFNLDLDQFVQVPDDLECFVLYDTRLPINQ